MERGGNDGTKQHMRVEIYGEQYVLRGQASADHLQAIAKYIDNTMTRIADSDARLDIQRVAVLTALNVADEYFRLREEYEQLLQALEQE